jgi:hypothetical protein
MKNFDAASLFPKDHWIHLLQKVCPQSLDDVAVVVHQRLEHEVELAPATTFKQNFIWANVHKIQAKFHLGKCPQNSSKISFEDMSTKFKQIFSWGNVHKIQAKFHLGKCPQNSSKISVGEMSTKSKQNFCWGNV